MNLQVPVSELQKHSLFIATPMYGGQCFGSYTKSIIDLSRVCMQYGINAQFSFIFNESLITRARNYLVDEFLRSNFTHLMFIDSDIDFNPMDVLYLLAVQKPIVGGPYPKKCIAWENIYDAVRYGLVPNDQRGMLEQFAGDFVFNAAAGTKELKLNEPQKVMEVGTGFVMIERSVFTKFAEAYPGLYYYPDHNRSAAFAGDRQIYQYFQAEIVENNGRGRYLSEDYWFCQKAQAIGIDTWFCPWMQIKHHGTYIYGGSIPAMATVINERMKRNDPVPPPASMQTVSTQAPQQELTMAHLAQLPRQQRRAILREIAEKNGKDAERVRALYESLKDTWPEGALASAFIAKVGELE